MNYSPNERYSVNQIINICLYVLTRNQLITYDQVAHVIGLSTSDLKKLLMKMDHRITAAIVECYKDGRGKVIKLEQNSIREKFGIIHTPHEHLGQKPRVIPLEFMSNISNSELEKIATSRPVQILISECSKNVTFKIFLSGGLIKQWHSKPDTDDHLSISHLYAKNGIKELSEKFIKKNLKQNNNNLSSKKLDLDMEDARSRATKAYAIINKTLKNTLYEYFDKEFSRDHIAQNFSISTTIDYIQHGSMIQIDKEFRED